MYLKVLFMDEQQQSLQELKHIKDMMERSSKFISLSGLSGIAAGICALAGAWFASQVINCWVKGDCSFARLAISDGNMQEKLFLIALLTFIAAFISSFFFTWLRSKRTGDRLWGPTTMRLLWNTAILLLAGGLFLFRSMQLEQYGLIAPGCLIFYGLALINASKYTLGEIRFLGYAQVLLGIANLWMIGYGLYFWAAGFGLLHIIYGFIMWWKYERNKLEDK